LWNYNATDITKWTFLRSIIYTWIIQWPFYKHHVTSYCPWVGRPKKGAVRRTIKSADKIGRLYRPSKIGLFLMSHEWHDRRHYRPRENEFIRRRSNSRACVFSRSYCYTVWSAIGIMLLSVFMSSRTWLQNFILQLHVLGQQRLFNHAKPEWVTLFLRRKWLSNS